MATATSIIICAAFALAASCTVVSCLHSARSRSASSAFFALSAAFSAASALASSSAVNCCMAFASSTTAARWVCTAGGGPAAYRFSSSGLLATQPPPRPRTRRCTVSYMRRPYVESELPHCSFLPPNETQLRPRGTPVARSITSNSTEASSLPRSPLTARVRSCRTKSCSIVFRAKGPIEKTAPPPPKRDGYTRTPVPEPPRPLAGGAGLSRAPGLYGLLLRSVGKLSR